MLGQRLDVAHPGQHPHDLLERSHLADGPELITEILERELVRTDLLLELRRVFLRDRLFRAFDERQHVAHAEHTGDHTIRVERLQVFQPLTAADKRDRHADDRHHRQRRATARIAVHLRQHDAGDADAAVKLAGALNGVLPRHRIRDVEQIRRVGDALDRHKLGHELVVDVQPPGRVDDDDVEPLRRGLGHRPPGTRHRVEVTGRIEHLHASLARHDIQLRNGRGTLDVGRHQQRMPPLLRQPQGQLAGRRGLACALQPEQQDDPRPFAALGEPALRVTEEAEHLIPDDLDDLLRRRQALENRCLHGLVAHAIDERLDDLEIDVGFEQRETDLAKGRFDVLGRQPPLPPQ